MAVIMTVMVKKPVVNLEPVVELQRVVRDVMMALMVKRRVLNLVPVVKPQPAECEPLQLVYFRDR